MTKTPGHDAAEAFVALRRFLVENGGAALLEDLTRLNDELVETRLELADKNTEPEHLNRETNHFLAMAAHDLRSPLGSIIMCSEVLLDAVADSLSGRHVEMLTEIGRAGERMLRVVEDFLNVSSIESGELRLRPREVNLTSLVQSNVAAHRALGRKKGTDIRVHCADGLPLIGVDPDKIEQVLDNLISNAVKYSPPGAAVDVYVGKKDGWAVIAVVDNGQGIPADEQDRLFEAFGKTSVRGTAGERSTGMGLLIVKRIVEGHGGRVYVESEFGRGSTLTVELPLDGEQVPGSRHRARTLR